MFFYPTQWKVISYVNLKPTLSLWKQIKTHQSQIVNYCRTINNATWYTLTDCNAFTPYVRSKVKYVDQLKDIIAEYLTPQPKRVKRGILNFGGDILKFLFGTLTQSDAKKYTEHIKTLENEQQSFLRISQEQMVVLKSAITSFNITMRKVNRNERLLNENLQRLNQLLVDEINQIHTQIDSVMMVNENIRQIQRGLLECQHTFEILVDAFLHAQDGVIQPQLMTLTKVRDMVKTESLPDGLDFPSFPSIELSKIITPVIFSQNLYLVYILQIPLLQSTPYQLYKLQPFPIQQQEKVFTYIKATKEFIFTNTIRQKYGKLSYSELQACFMPNELSYVCKENIPIVTYIPNMDCESTLIHPSTMQIPSKVCEQRVLTLENTYWIPLHLSNEWLFTAPSTELFTVLCGTEKFQLTLHNRGKLYLPPRCKGYSTHNTLYALSTLESNNSQDDILPLASVDIDCCLTVEEKEQLHKIPLQKPLTNILSSIEDLNMASVKIDEVQKLIDAEKAKRYEHFQVLTATWGTVVITIVLIIICICCSCCCCKCCRRCVFWIWDKWTPRECISQTRERCCVITNINADRVLYSELPQTPPLTPISVRSLPLSLQEHPPPQPRIPETRRRSASRLSEEFLKTTKLRERKGER
jgi:hypothetical protein